MNNHSLPSLSLMLDVPETIVIRNAGKKRKKSMANDYNKKDKNIRESVEREVKDKRIISSPGAIQFHQKQGSHPT